jgi:hypothetical protein
MAAMAQYFYVKMQEKRDENSIHEKSIHKKIDGAKNFSLSGTHII